MPNSNKKIENIYLVLFAIFSFCVITYGSYNDYLSIKNVINTSNIISILITYIAGLTGVLCVFLVAKENILNYLFGIISVSLWFIYVVLWSPLIWDALINIIYLILNFYGLYYWLNPKKNQKSKNKIALTRKLTIKECILYSLSGIIAIVILSFIGRKIGRYESNTQAVTDAASTVFAILGQWFMSIKVLENWYMWIIVNIISIPLYISIGSYTLAMVWVAYLVNAIYGFIMWKKNMNNM